MSRWQVERNCGPVKVPLPKNFLSLTVMKHQASCCFVFSIRMHTLLNASYTFKASFREIPMVISKPKKILLVELGKWRADWRCWPLKCVCDSMMTGLRQTINSEMYGGLIPGPPSRPKPLRTIINGMDRTIIWLDQRNVAILMAVAFFDPRSECLMPIMVCTYLTKN